MGHELKGKVGHENRKQFFKSLYCLLLQLLKQKSMFVALHSDINSLKSGLLHLTGKLNFQKGGLTEVKDRIILETKFLGIVSYINFG
jgi:hypothetical protein